jgi:hypothetical protein
MKLADSSTQDDVEDVRLWLPSELSPELRLHGCHKGLAFMEEQLRESQCRDALDTVRNLLRTKMHFIHYRNRNTRGQIRATRAHTLIDSIASKTKLAASRYRDARNALLVLRGPGQWEEELRALNDEDIRLPTSSNFDIEDPDDLIGQDGRSKSKKKRDEIEKRLGEGYRILSWIWLNAVGDQEAGGEELNEGAFASSSFNPRN